VLVQRGIGRDGWDISFTQSFTAGIKVALRVELLVAGDVCDALLVPG
jgi:hypothetical protein